MTETLYTQRAEIQSKLSSLQQALIKSLLYSSIFRYPLTLTEVIENTHLAVTEAEAKKSLQYLLAENLVSEEKGFYFLGEENGMIQHRLNGNRKARAYLRIARIFTSLIASSPFVRGVMLTGSLSKGTVEKKGDVDYFIITKPGRLWLCRTFLILFKKVFLLNSRKYFCVNYFIDTNNLVIPDQNIFTATEISHVLPAYGVATCKDFITANAWISQYFPNNSIAPKHKIQSRTFNILKPIVEFLLSGSLGNKLDDWCLKKTHAHWKQKHQSIEQHVFEDNFKSKKYISKHHPHGFQFRIVEEYEKQIAMFEAQHNISLG